MRWPKFLRRTSAVPSGPLVVSFTGGMGAQIISASIYFSKRQAGQTVYADLSYFEKPEAVAVAGNAGECSHWAWQLDRFGLSKGAFEPAPPTDKANVLHDGPGKMELGLEALSEPHVRHHFSLPAEAAAALPAAFSEGYLCIHIRRGDYVNVASHLIPDEEFLRMAAKFSGLIPHVAVLSDSPIAPKLRSAISAYFQDSVFLDNTDAFTAHCVMRAARILVCSNSQFSLIAAILNTHALVFIPRQWFDGNDRAIEAPLHRRCSFQILDV